MWRRVKTNLFVRWQEGLIYSVNTSIITCFKFCRRSYADRSSESVSRQPCQAVHGNISYYSGEANVQFQS
jgi:hypothetical protein